MDIAANTANEVAEMSGVESSHSGEAQQISPSLAAWFLVNIILVDVVATMFFGFAGFVTFAVAAAITMLGVIVVLTNG